MRVSGIQERGSVFINGKAAHRSYPFGGDRNGLSVHGYLGTFTHTIRNGWRMGFLTHLYQTERMTDVGFWPERNRPSNKKNWFLEDNGGPRRSQMVGPSHHTDHTTVNGHVEEEDIKGSTWISKDAQWIPRVQGICRPGSVKWSVETVLVVWKARVEERQFTTLVVYYKSRNPEI